METPIISVIITLNKNRTEYVSHAIESAVSQSINRNKYEVLLVRDFQDQKVSELTKKNDIVDVVIEEYGLVPKILEGLNTSRGDIICFLDDDDIFYNTKLEKILEVFSRNPKLAYYHNAHRVMDHKGNPLPSSIRAIPEEDYVLRGEKISSAQIRKANHFGGGFNLSSISLRRSHLADVLKDLVYIKQNLDSFFFYSSVDSGFDVMLGKDILTHYRVHYSNISGLKKNSDPMISIKYYEGSVGSLSNLRDRMKSEVLRKVINCSLIEAQVKLYFVDPERTCPLPVGFIFSNIKCALITSEKYRVLLGLWSFLTRLSGKYARKVYYSSKYRESKEFDLPESEK